MPTKDQLSVAYDTLYEAGSEIIKRHNPCRIEVINGKTTCFATRTDPNYDNNTGQLCCTNCKHLGPDGCTVKAIWCKFWTCYYLHKEQHPVIIPLQALRKTARKVGITVHEGRFTKEEVLEGRPHVNW